MLVSFLLQPHKTHLNSVLLIKLIFTLNPNIFVSDVLNDNSASQFKSDTVSSKSILDAVSKMFRVYIIIVWIHTKLKTKYKVDNQWLDAEYGIYFTNETGFFLFSRLQSKSENKTKYSLPSELNSLFITRIWKQTYDKIRCIIIIIWYHLRSILCQQRELS